MKPYLSIVVPIFNEEESVERLIEAIHEQAYRLGRDYEIILIDDGSTDGTWKSIERLKETTPHLRGIKFRRNFGQTAAMVAGFEHASGQVIITMDGDLQNDPADIPLLLRKMEEGYDIVSGWRKDRKDHWSRVIPSKVANWIISVTTGVRLHDYGCSLKAYRTECIKAIKAYSEMHRFFPVLTSMTGAQVAEVAVNHHARKYGKSKYGLNRIFKVFSDIFSIILIVKFSSRPLLAFTFCAFPFFCLGIFFGILLFVSINLNWTPGKAMFFGFTSGLSFMAMIHLIAIGVISELVVRASDHSHTQLPKITQKIFVVSQTENIELNSFMKTCEKTDK
jgi:glycosyltransferase involved in cell wall biosynthesis